jgi:Fe2+ or Zn2+ uptake regulation protein
LGSDQIQRMTHQRRIILEEIQKDHSHPTADEVYEIVRKKLPRISLGTVYRNLDILTSSGLIRKLDPVRTQMRFDGNIKEHYHITCIHCGRIEDAQFEPSEHALENIENALGNLTKYGIFGHRLEFIGICEECSSKGHMFPKD